VAATIVDAALGAWKCAIRPKARPLCWPGCAASCLPARSRKACGKRLGWPESIPPL
jgi:hypothetical protein